MISRSTMRLAGGVVLAALLFFGAAPSFSAATIERFDATAYGTSTQSGKIFHVQFSLSRLSTPEQRQILVDAFAKDKTPGLVKALSKMKSVGRVSVPGKTGYDIEYATLIKTPTGRKIRIITNRWLMFVELYHMTRSQDYPLTVADIDLNEQDNSLSSGVLAPAAKFTVNKQGEVQFELYQNPWKLQSFIDWNKKNEK